MPWQDGCKEAFHTRGPGLSTGSFSGASRAPAALAALYLARGTLNVYSQVVLVTLIGLITKHGILIVEFATQLRARGLDMFETVECAAGSIRRAGYASGDGGRRGGSIER